MTMNPVIKFEDYRKIGTMETALSKHADEAFFELSGERQKVAEKIFKCLTETDRENRVIRRATTVEKLSAVADADLPDVVAVIEVFRKEGRTFLMPPPEVSLNADSLIDISHESLIRKWEKLTKWVEEEGQSAGLYRRLAEDALLYSKGKVGFWSEPELSEALDWRENFKPNETWAELYREKGERQYKASFDDSMVFLDESKIDRDKKLAKEKNRRILLGALTVLFFITTVVAVIAAIRAQKSEERANLADEVAKQSEEKARLAGEITKQNETLKENAEKLEVQKSELENQKSELEKQKEIAENEKVNAEKQTELAKVSEAAAQKASEEQKRLAGEAKDATNIADMQRKNAVMALMQAHAVLGREELNRAGLTFLEQGEFEKALPVFEELLKSYQNENEPMSQETRTQGKWWALHNLGIICSKLENFDRAQEFFISAINTLGSANKGNTSQTIRPQNSAQYFTTVSYESEEEGINRSLVTTFRRLAQLYRARALKPTTRETDVMIYNQRAVEAYGYLLETLKKDPVDEKQPNYPVEVWVEVADVYADLRGYAEAIKYYRDAEKVYQNKNDLIKQVEVLIKWADVAAVYNSKNRTVEREKRVNKEMAVDLVEKAIYIQETKLKLSVVSLEIAESYNKLDRAYKRTAEGDVWVYPPYDKISEKTRQLNSMVYSTGLKFYSAAVINELSDAYVAIGNCRRAEEVYLFGIDRSTQATAEGKNLRGSFADLEFKVDLAEFYQNVMRDEEKAQKYFDEFTVESEKKRDAGFPVRGELFIKAGDFYFARRDYPKAEKFYLHVLQLIEPERLAFENLDSSTDDAKKINLLKAEVLIKAVRVYEAQSKWSEAEAMYSQAVATINKTFGETGIKSAEFLLYQADFYAERGNTKKATEIYGKAEAIANAADEFPKDQLMIQIHVQKKLGDINRDNAGIAAAYYEKALSAMERFDEIQGGETYRRFMGTEMEACAPKEVNRYTTDIDLTEEFWIDYLKIIEALVSLDGAKDADARQGKIERAKQNLERLQTSPCEKDK